VPAAAVVLAAHRELEKLVLHDSSEQLQGGAREPVAYLCYAGLWLEPLRSDLDAYMDSVNEFVTGEVALEALPWLRDPDPAHLALRAV